MSTELKGGKKLVSDLRSRLGKATVSVGFFENAKYEDGTPVAQVAYWNNFGTVRGNGFIPPRPFFSDTVRQNKNNWVKKTGQLLKKYKNPEKVGDIIGNEMKQDLANSILNSRAGSPYKANAPSTLKMSNNPNKEPLKDTFHMAKSVGYEVK